MKRKIGIISIFVAMILVISGLFTIFASTNTTPPTLSISGKNISFSDSIYIVFYVEAQNIDANDVKLLVWDDARESYTINDSPKTLSYLRTETIDGKDYLRFEYRGLAAKNMTDTIYARAFVTSGTSDYYSEITNYSVLQYVYNKLGKTGTASTDEALKTLLADMLEYGAAAQTSFNYNVDRLATKEFWQISVTGGVLPDKCTRGLFLTKETVVLTANEPADGMTFSHWTNEAGDVLSTSPTLTVTVESSNAAYTAVFAASEE